jgi:hypothetical protein
MKSLIHVCAAALVCAVAFAQPAHTAARAAKFSSAYTDLKKQCREISVSEEAQGGDTPLRCRGLGGYEIWIGFSAASSHLSVQRKGDRDEDSIVLTTQSLRYDSKRKIEWRLADGKPFAVILRVDRPKDGLDASEMWLPENKAGESLLIKGLKGHERIDFEVDAKTPNANEKARELADGAYAKGD